MTNPLEQIRDVIADTLNAVEKMREVRHILDASQDYVCVPVEVMKDTTRMDWLVSHDVEVRDPRLHGSSHLFTAQTTSDEEDEIYQTSLREQIDAAMLAASKETNRE